MRTFGGNNVFSYNTAYNKSWPSYYERKVSAQRENKLLPLSGACEVSSMCYVTLHLLYLPSCSIVWQGHMRAIEKRDFPSKTASRQMQANTGRQISAGKYQQANKGKQRPAGFELIADPQSIAVTAGICINMELKREHWRR